MQHPIDRQRVTEYGSVGEIPSAMFEHFTKGFQSPDAPDPREVSEAIVRLVGLPKGTRPARTVVGAAFGSDTINAQTAPVQSQVLASLGLTQLANLV